MEHSKNINPTISVIVPVYNVENYLSACIDSILNQTFQDFELILVDDGSTDNSPQICNEYARKDSRIQVVHQENQGQAAARNYGISRSVGSWVHFVDSDDLLHPQMLEILYKAVCETGAKISISRYATGSICPEGFCETVECNFKTWCISDETMSSFILEQNSPYFVVWGKLIKREIVEEFPFENGRIYEDTAIICKWYREANIIALVDANLYFYYINASGTMGSTWSRKKLDRIWCNAENMSFYKSLGWKQCFNVFVKIQIRHLAYSYYNIKKNDKSIELRLKIFWKWVVMRIIHHRIWKTVSFEDRMNTYWHISPKFVEFFWLCQALRNKLKERGIFGAIQSAVSRIMKKVGGNR